MVISKSCHQTRFRRVITTYDRAEFIDIQVVNSNAIFESSKDHFLLLLLSIITSGDCTTAISVDFYHYLWWFIFIISLEFHSYKSHRSNWTVIPETKSNTDIWRLDNSNIRIEILYWSYLNLWATSISLAKSSAAFNTLVAWGVGALAWRRRRNGCRCRNGCRNGRRNRGRARVDGTVGCCFCTVAYSITAAVANRSRSWTWNAHTRSATWWESASLSIKTGVS